MFHRLISPLKEGRSPVSIQGAKGSFKAFFISQIEKEIEGPIVVVTSSPIEAERIFNDLKCFMGKGEYPLLGPDRGIHLLPPWDTLPFEKTSPYILIQAKRMETLFSIIASKVPPIIILPIRSLMQRVVPRSHLRDVKITISPGKRISPEEISQRLMNGGFISSPICEERGDFSSRGGILDCFPPLYEFPIRMEFFGDQIDSVRHFDPRTQRSLDPVSEAVIIPVREIPWDQESRKLALSRILDTKLNGKGEDILVLLERIEEGIGFPGIEYMLPFFHHHLETVFDYMRGMPIFVIDGPSYVENTAYEFWNEIQSRYGNAIKDGRPFPPEEEIYIHPEEIRKRLEGLLVINFDDLEIIEGPIKEHPEPFRVLIETNEDLRREMLHQPMDEGIFRGFAERINNWITRGMEIHLFGHTWGEAQRIKDILEEYGVTIKWHEGEGFKPKGGFQDKIPCQIHTGVLSQGFRFEEGRIIVLTDEDIFGPRRPQRTRKSYREAPVITDFEDLKENDLIVHVEHGVGIFRGLSHLNVEGSYGDFLTIEYLGNDRLYVPVYKLNMVHRYIGTEGFMPKLDRLGSKAWERRKKQASESIRKMAKELLEVYAAREALQGFAFNRDDPYYHEFERAFEYEETPDQKVAIEDVLKDMERPRPMDRLICGDVGYGKTEVAMRAAFKAVMHGKQVAVLVPTTILAQQHYQTFQDRFRGYPVFIQVLSRFKNRAEQKE
ncbi:MAG: CarD family transcriptional regulator, partial [Candidatus Bathyarchaeia archaeon]